MSTDIGLIVVSFLPNCAAYWFIYQLFLNRRDLRSKQFGYIEFWCGLIGLLYLYFSIVALVMLSFFSENDIVNLILLVGSIASGLIAYIYATETSARESVIEAREKYISDNSAAIDKFPEYIGTSTVVQDIVKSARIPEGFVGPVTAVLDSHVGETKGITRTELIAKLRESENPRYVLEYALAEQMPGKVAAHDVAVEVSGLFMDAPKVLEYSPDGVPLRQFISAPRGCTLPKELIEQLLNIPARLTLPDGLRITHHQIISSSGHGKTSLIQSMILDDIEENAAIVVIDSQNRMINELAERVPQDRLILIDPEHCPPAMNMFDKAGTDEKSVANALELYEYIFSALEAGMTSKQTLVYRYFSRLCMVVPGASLATMRDMLKPGGIDPYQQYIDQLGENAKTFFDECAQTRNQYSETRQEVQRRLLTVLQSDTFARMLGGAENKLNLSGALEAGKIVLVSTNKDMLKGNAALLGRIFLAQVMQVVMSRKDNPKRVYLYVDEFRDYAEDSEILINLFSQSRKYNLAMIICHQALSDLTPKLADSISTNTCIKMVGGVSVEDATRMAKKVRLDEDSIGRLRIGEFYAWFKGLGTYAWSVDPNRLSRMPKLRDLSRIHQDMRDRYGVTEPRKAKIVFRKAKDVEEKGKW